MTIAIVYAIIEKPTDTIVYVGSTIRPNGRYKEHQRKLRVPSVRMLMLDMVPQDDRWNVEDEWLGFFMRNNNCGLLNVLSTTKLWSDRAGKSRSTKTKAKISASLMGHSVSNEARKRMNEADKYYYYSPEVRKQMSAKKKTWWAVPENRELMRAKRKAWWAVPKNRELMRKAQRR